MTTEESKKVMKISQEQLQGIIAAQEKANQLAEKSQAAVKDARMAELEFRVAVNSVYLENGLHKNCKIELSTGQVSWPEAKKEVVTAEVPTVEQETVVEEEVGE